MADLLVELWNLIFDRLELTDLSSCAQVSKKFYCLVKEYPIRELAFTLRVHSWAHITAPITNHKHRVDFTMASILSDSSFNLERLKRLKIGRLSSIDLSDINKFARLEELDIDLKKYAVKANRTLSLANLQVLYVFVAEDHYMELDTPRLEKLFTANLEALEVFYPESVRCIHTFFHNGKLSAFRNLEYLLFTDYYLALENSSNFFHQRFRQFSLTSLKKLKEISFCFHHSGYERKNLENFKEIVSTIQDLNRPDLKLFWEDVRVTDANLLTEYGNTVGLGSESLVAFQLNHYDKLKERVDFYWCHYFNKSIKLMSAAGFNPRGDGFLSKYFAKHSFRRIEVFGAVEEPELLMQLIAISSNLLALCFKSSGLDQAFFDRMADTIRLNRIPLQTLWLYDSSGLNFEFVTKLSDLQTFKTDQKLPGELVLKLLGLPLLTHILFSSFKCQIERLPARKFRLDKSFLDLQELERILNV